MAHFWDWFQGGVMLPRPSHPMVHPEPAPVVMVEVAQGQGLAPAPNAVAQGQVQAGALAAAAAEQGEDANGNAPPPGVLMVDLLWAPGTRWGVGIRLAQALLAATAIAFMISTHDFWAVTAFRHLIVAAGLQCFWSLALGILDVYSLLVKRFFRNPTLTSILSFGDWVMGAFTLATAIGSAAITFLINNEMQMCSDNHCPSFTAAAVMAFLSWFAIVPSCLCNLWAAVQRVQAP